MSARTERSGAQDSKRSSVFGGLDHPNALLTAEQAAPLLAVKPKWLLAEARAGRIPHVRLGAKPYVRFEAAELEVWWRARRHGPHVRTGSRPVSNGGDPR
jgi:excisionase family DNA binding protein